MPTEPKNADEIRSSLISWLLRNDNDTGEMDGLEARLDQYREAIRIDTLKQVREREWKPKYQPESEEERGYQKGLMAQIALTNSRIDDLVKELTQPK